MASDPKRLDQVLQHIRRIKADDYPVILGNTNEGGDYRIIERPWQDIPEPSKLAILEDAVNWEGISNHDQALILLNEIDPGRITDAQRNRLIDMATGNQSLWERLQAAGNGRNVPQNERSNEDAGRDGNERGGRRR